MKYFWYAKNMAQAAMKEPLIINYYTDILCVWAWIAQRRVDELNSQLGSEIALRYQYVDVFGDLAGKMQSLWKDRGMFEGFADHVHKAASGFEDAPVLFVEQSLSPLPGVVRLDLWQL